MVLRTCCARVKENRAFLEIILKFATTLDLKKYSPPPDGKKKREKEEISETMGKRGKRGKTNK